MNYFREDDEIFPEIKNELTWIYNKLSLSLVQGIPATTDNNYPIDRHKKYIVRPIINLNGMGRGAIILHGDDIMAGHRIPDGYFLQPYLDGDVETIDFHLGNSVCRVIGSRRDDEISFDKWSKVDNRKLNIHPDIKNVIDKFEIFNIELIHDNTSGLDIVIDAHPSRWNPDFNNKDGATELTVVRDFEDLKKGDGKVFYYDHEYNRIGFFVEK